MLSLMSCLHTGVCVAYFSSKIAEAFAHGNAADDNRAIVYFKVEGFLILFD